MHQRNHEKKLIGVTRFLHQPDNMTQRKDEPVSRYGSLAICFTHEGAEMDNQQWAPGWAIAHHQRVAAPGQKKELLPVAKGLATSRGRT
jgi:hypothetical protein